MALSSVHQHNPDCDIWVHEYFTPSWFCLPNNQPALTVIRPGDTSRDVLEMICKVNCPGAGGQTVQPVCQGLGCSALGHQLCVRCQTQIPCGVEARSAAENSVQLELLFPEPAMLCPCSGTRLSVGPHIVALPLRCPQLCIPWPLCQAGEVMSALPRRQGTCLHVPSLLPSPRDSSSTSTGRRCLLPALQNQSQPRVGGRRDRGNLLSALEWGEEKPLLDEVSETLGH